MKKIKIITLMAFVFLLGSCSKVSQYFEDPIVYNDEIVDIYNSIVDDYNNYDTYYLETSWTYFDKIEEKRLSTIDVIKGKIVELEMIGDFRDNEVLLRSAIDGSEDIITVLETHDKDLLTTWSDFVNEEINEEEYNTKSEAIVALAIEDLDLIRNNFEITQQAFAKKYDYEIEKSEE